MSENTEAILQQALALPLKERAELLEQLLATFQDPTDGGLDQLWTNEAHERLDAFDRGELTSIDLEEALRNINSQNRK